MIRRPPRSTLDPSAAASDVYKRQADRPLTADDQIEVVDSQGRIVHIASGRGSPEILLERKGLSSGRYSIKLTKGGRLLGVAGFVVE